MNDLHFDDFARRVDAGATRRGLLRGVVAVGTTLGLAAGFEDAAARKRKKKPGKKPHGEKPHGPTPPAPSLCAQACSAGCSTCYQRPSGTLICGGIGSANCAFPCGTDSNCAKGQICTKSFTDRATGETSSWGCPGNPPGVCTSFTVCMV